MKKPWVLFVILFGSMFLFQACSNSSVSEENDQGSSQNSSVENRNDKSKKATPSPALSNLPSNSSDGDTTDGNQDEEDGTQNQELLEDVPPSHRHALNTCKAIYKVMTSRHQEIPYAICGVEYQAYDQAIDATFREPLNVSLVEIRTQTKTNLDVCVQRFERACVRGLTIDSSRDSVAQCHDVLFQNYLYAGRVNSDLEVSPGVSEPQYHRDPICTSENLAFAQADRAFLREQIRVADGKRQGPRKKFERDFLKTGLALTTCRDEVLAVCAEIVAD